MSKRKYPTKDECAERGWYSKTELKQRRLKPAPGQFAVAQYWQGQGTVNVYEESRCVPMRPYRAPTPKQAEALARGRELLGTHECENEGCKNRVETWEDQRICQPCVNEAHAQSKRAISCNAVVLDSETTGLEGDDQVIEIAVVDWDGNTLVNQRIRPTVPIGVGAEAVHGISAADLADCPTWPEIAADVRAVLEGRPVVIFNASYDQRMLYQTAKATEGLDDLDWIINLDTHCAMYMAAREYGATNRYGTISLANAVIRAGVEWQGEAHSALGDALTTLALVRKMVM